MAFLDHGGVFRVSPRVTTIRCVGVLFDSPVAGGREVDIGFTDEQIQGFKHTLIPGGERVPIVNVTAWRPSIGTDIRLCTIATLHDVEVEDLIQITTPLASHPEVTFILRVRAARAEKADGVHMNLVMWPSKLRRTKRDIDET
jgi:hypothetical protein